MKKRLKWNVGTETTDVRCMAPPAPQREDILRAAPPNIKLVECYLSSRESNTFDAVL